MEIIKERINPEWDHENYDISYETKTVQIVTHYRFLEKNGVIKFLIKAIDLENQQETEITVFKKDCSKKVQENFEKFMQWEKGEKYLFIWKICKRKRWIYPTNTQRFVCSKNIRLFHGNKKVKEVRNRFLPGKCYVEMDLKGF